MARDKPGLVIIPIAEPSLAFPLGAATRREDVALTEAVDQVIVRLLATGSVDEILHRYRAVP
jgi:ABC-type amino acid transport substrate-binding protein